MRAVIHIGAEKTGTTALQDCLAASRSALEQSAILYPCSPGDRQHSRLAMYAMDDHRTNGLTNRMPPLFHADRSAWRNEVKNELDSELQGTTADTVVISTELFSSQVVSAAEVHRVRDLFDTWCEDYRIVIYLRRQDRAQVSRHSTQLRAGGTRPLTLPTSDSGRDVFDYDRIIGRWTEVFGETSMVPRLYERATARGADLVTDFVSAAGLRVDPAGLLRAPRKNEALSVRAQLVLTEFNKHLPSSLSGPQLVAFRRAVATAAEELFPGSPARPSRSDAQAFYATFEESNSRVAARWFDGVPLFDDAFEDYPDQADGHQPADVADIVAVSTRAAALLARTARAGQAPKTAS